MRIAVIGGGPSGSVIAALLARRGHDAVIFDEDCRTDPVVGESLVPGVIPVFRRLGIEEKVAAIGVRKPGVTFRPSQDKEFAFSFDSLPRRFPRYAYNVPRPEFDRILSDSAVESGVRSIPMRVELGAANDSLSLPSDALDQLPDWNGRQPDLFIDASGRRRRVAGLLGIPAEIGGRRDVSYFAHFEGFDQEKPAGQVRINRLANGWCWRIPLRGRMSFGIVLDRSAASALGHTPEERLDAVLKTDPLLREEAIKARRLTPVMAHGNYQLVSSRAYGANWVAVGDAYGFVDPMLSPGMMVALQSSVILDEELSSRPMAMALRNYETRVSVTLEAWRELIGYFYNGRIFDLNEQGKQHQARYPWFPFGKVDSFMSAVLSGMASGFTTDSPWSRGILRSSSRFVLGQTKEASRYAVA